MRTYGMTNVCQYSSSPPVGPSGDMYFNTTNKNLYISDGTAWRTFPPSYANLVTLIQQRPSPREGEVAYISSEDALRVWDGANWIPINTTGYHWYKWDTDITETAPALGYVKANNDDPSLATELYIHQLNLNNDYVFPLLSLSVGDAINVYWTIALTSWCTYAVIGAPVIGVDWVSVPVAVRNIGESGWGPLPDNDRVVVFVTQGGDVLSGAESNLPTGGKQFQQLGKYGDPDYQVEWAWPEKVLRQHVQSNHGLAIGNVVRLDSGWNYVKAIADSLANANAVGFVYSVDDVNTFTVITQGRVGGFSGLTVGVPYYLSANVAGNIVATEPVAQGKVSKMMLVPDTPNTGWIVNTRSRLNGNHYCKVHRNAAYTMPGTANQVVKIPWDFKDNDTENLFNTTTNEYTCPEDGIYFVRSSLSIQGSGATSTSVRNYLNGVQDCIINSYSGVSSAICIEATSMLKCVAGDKITTYGSASIASPTMRLNVNESYMTVTFMGPA
jgi:hypothetical protein